MLCFSLSNLHGGSHKHWIFVEYLLVCDVNLKLNLLTMISQAVSNLFINQLWCYLITLCKHYQMFTLMEFFLLFLCSWWFWNREIFWFDLTQHGLEVFMSVKHLLNSTLWADHKLTLDWWCWVVISSHEPYRNIHCQSIFIWPNSLIDVVWQQTMSLLQLQFEMRVETILSSCGIECVLRIRCLPRKQISIRHITNLLTLS